MYAFRKIVKLLFNVPIKQFASVQLLELVAVPTDTPLKYNVQAEPFLTKAICVHVDSGTVLELVIKLEPPDQADIFPKVFDWKSSSLVVPTPLPKSKIDPLLVYAFKYNQHSIVSDPVPKLKFWLLGNFK